MNRFWKLRHQEHEVGWSVLLGGERVAELDYLRDDQPFHLFQARLLTDDAAKIDYALRNTKREPGDKLQFNCRAGNVVVPDRDFFINLHADGRVSIRDMRPGPVLSTPQQLWKKFTSELFAPGRFGFYGCTALAAIAGVGIVVVAALRTRLFVWIWLICVAMLLAVRALVYAILKTNHQTAARRT